MQPCALYLGIFNMLLDDSPGRNVWLLSVVDKAAFNISFQPLSYDAFICCCRTWNVETHAPCHIALWCNLDHKSTTHVSILVFLSLDLRSHCLLAQRIFLLLITISCSVIHRPPFNIWNDCIFQSDGATEWWNNWIWLADQFAVKQQFPVLQYDQRCWTRVVYLLLLLSSFKTSLLWINILDHFDMLLLEMYFYLIKLDELRFILIPNWCMNSHYHILYYPCHW